MKLNVATGILLQTLSLTHSEQEEEERRRRQRRVVASTTTHETRRRDEHQNQEQQQHYDSEDANELREENLARLLREQQQKGSRQYRPSSRSSSSNRRRRRFSQSQRSSISNLLKNSLLHLVNDETKDESMMVACHPSSDDPDTGVLSCPSGYHCEPVLDSYLDGECIPMGGVGGGDDPTTTTTTTTSTNGRRWNFGGTKTSSLSSSSSLMASRHQHHHRRHLVFSADDAGVCIPGHPYFQTNDCDCSNFDNVTGTGTVPCIDFSNRCLGDIYPGCDDTCITRTLEYDFTNFVSPSYINCFIATSPYYQKVCFEEQFADATCTLALNGDACTTCTIIPNGDNSFLEFDCTNVGGQKGTTAKDNTELLPILQACGQLDYCNLCGPGEYVDPNNYGIILTTTLPGYGVTTCEGLTYPAYQNTTIDGQTCAIMADAVQEGGCCTQTVLEPTYYCTFCGDLPFYEDRTVKIQEYTLACGDFRPLLNDTMCDMSGPLLAETCCQPEAGTLVPTKAPSTRSPTPPSSSTTSPLVGWWTMNDRYSIPLMGLVVAMTSTAGVFLLF